MAKAPSRAGRFFTAVFRILTLTLLFAGVGMGLGLFFGIFGAILYGAVKHTNIDMSLAYRDVAIPLALVFAALAFLYNIVAAIRRSFRSAHP